MGKIAFLFPGQGAQYVGMGKELYDNFEEFRSIFEKANNVLGYSLKEVCFNSEEEFLGRTDNTQPALLAVSIATLQVLKSNGIECDIVTGLSLGEYSALVCSGVVTFEDALQLVQKRGKYMQKCADETKGTLAAIMGLSLEKVEEILLSVKNEGIISVANLNCPGQIVIGGEYSLVEKAMKLCEESGAKRVLMLKVSGAFHTGLMEEASVKLEEEFKKVNINNRRCNVVMNFTGDFLSEDDNLVEIMKMQVKSTVKFEESIKKLVENGVDTFVEIGPGKVLSGFVKKIDRKLVTLNIENIESLNTTLEKLRG